VREVFGARLLNRELDEELAAHLELHIDDNLRAGMSPAEARRQALPQRHAVLPPRGFCQRATTRQGAAPPGSCGRSLLSVGEKTSLCRSQGAANQKNQKLRPV